MERYGSPIWGRSRGWLGCGWEGMGRLLVLHGSRAAPSRAAWLFNRGINIYIYIYMAIDIDIDI